MNRRAFIKLVGLVVAVPSLPTGGKPKDYMGEMNRLTQKQWDGALFSDAFKVAQFNSMPGNSECGIWSVDTAIPEAA